MFVLRIFLQSRYILILGSFFLKHTFNILTVKLWKSKRPVPIVQEDWKNRGWFVRMRSIHVDLSLFLKQVGFFMSDFKLSDSLNVLKYLFEIFELKSPNKMQLSNFSKR